MAERTIRPNKGDLVPGHKVAAFLSSGYVIKGEIIGANRSGSSVTFDVGAGFAALGLPRKTEWTWRRSAGAYQQKGERTGKGHGLALIKQ